MSPSDAELVRQVRAGSQTACHALVARYASAAVNVAARLVGNRAVAEELAQDAFVRAFTRLDTYDTGRRFSTWFFKVLHNVVIDDLRRRRIDTVSLDELEAQGHPGAVSADVGMAPDVETERRLLAAAMTSALGRIRAEYREAIVLRYQQDLGIEEIGDILDLPAGTVKTYLHRGRKELAEILSAAGWKPEG